MTATTIIYMYGDHIGYIEDGIVRYRQRQHVRDIARSVPSGLTQKEVSRPILDMAAEMGLRYYSLWHVQPALQACNDKPVSELRDELRRRAAISRSKRNRDAEYEAQWAELEKRFGNMVIGVDDVDVYATGLTVEVLLNSTVTFDEQLAWVKKNRTALIRYVQQAMPRTKRISKRTRQMALDVLPACRLSEAVLTRRNTLQLKYDVRDEIRKALEEENGHG